MESNPVPGAGAPPVSHLLDPFPLVQPLATSSSVMLHGPSQAPRWQTTNEVRSASVALVPLGWAFRCLPAGSQHAPWQWPTFLSPSRVHTKWNYVELHIARSHSHRFRLSGFGGPGNVHFQSFAGRSEGAGPDTSIADRWPGPSPASPNQAGRARKAFVSP